MQGVRPQPRIQLVDALRGYALMGLFLIHMVEYYELYGANPLPSRVNSTMFFLFGGKAYAMFGLLFGVSFYILMEGQARRGVDFRARFVWRLMVLLPMGYLHSLVLGGDILTVLAITGLILVPLYRWSNVALLCVAAFFVLQGPMLLLHAFGRGSWNAGVYATLMDALRPWIDHGRGARQRVGRPGQQMGIHDRQRPYLEYRRLVSARIRVGPGRILH